MATNANFQDQRVSSTKKKTDKEWYIPMANFVIELAKASSDKTMTRDCINAANGVLDPKDFEYVMKTYMSANETTSKELELESAKLGNLRDIDILTPIKEKYMGEFINYYHNYQVYSLAPDVVFKRNEVIGEKVVSQMFKKLQDIISSSDGKADIDIKGFVDKELANWQDENIIKEQRTLEMLNSVIDAKRKYIDAYFNWWACEEVYTYRRLSGNDVIFDVISPLEYYRVDSGNYFVEDDHYGMRRYIITLQEIIDTFYNNMKDGLSESQYKLLKKMIESSDASIGIITTSDFRDFNDNFRENNISSSVDFTKKGFKTVVDHYFFKTEIKRGILTYMSIDGETTMDVDEDYKLSKKDGDISIEWKWIDQMWEGWVFGEDTLRLHIPPRPVELQRELVSNTSICKAPYNGISYIHKHSARKPIAYRIKDNMALYKIYTLLEERWLNKFKSWMTIPETILYDTDEYSVEDRLQQADIDSIFPFNDAALQANPNAINMIREVATTAVIKYVEILNQVKQSIKQDTWELANMNDSRFGGNNQYKGKAVSEYDYNQAVKGTVWMLEAFNSFRERDYMANLDYSRAAWIDGKQGSFIDPNTKEVVYVDVDGLAHLGANVGLYISNSAELNSQAEALKQLAFSMGQNNDPSVAVEAITNKNIAALKQTILKASAAQKEFEMKMSTAKEEAMGRLKELEIADNKEERLFTMELQASINDIDYQIAVLKSETDISINEARLEVDRNGNGYIDSTEADNSVDGTIQAKERAVQMLNQRKQALAELKFAHTMKKDNANSIAKRK